MRRDDDGNGSVANVAAEECATCVRMRFLGPELHTMEMVPADGGGWSMWSAALLRLLQRVGQEPTRAMIITQPLLNDRYVQVLIGHGIARAEVGSNVYLMGESRLSGDQEELLALLGWQAPISDVEDPDEMPANWTLPLLRGDWQHLTEMFSATMIGILGFSEHLPVELRAFGADNPCRDCSWGDDLEEEEDC